MSLCTLLLKKGKRKMLKISWWDLGNDNHFVLCSRVQVLPSPSGSEANIFLVKQFVFFKVCTREARRTKSKCWVVAGENESMDCSCMVACRWMWGRKSCPNIWLEVLWPAGLAPFCNIPDPPESPPATSPQAWGKVADIGQSESRFLEIANEYQILIFFFSPKSIEQVMLWSGVVRASWGQSFKKLVFFQGVTHVTLQEWWSWF